MRLPCKRGEDAIIDALRETFHAHPVRVPDGRLVALCVLAAYEGGETFWRGALAELVEGDFAFPDSAIQRTSVTDAFSKESRDLDVEVGLKLLEGLASGFGLTAAMPSLKSTLTRSRSVSFAVSDVVRDYVDVGTISKILGMRKLRRNAATEIFFAEPAASLLLVDSTLAASSFTVTFDRGGKTSAAIDLGAIEKLVGNVKVKLSEASAQRKALTFHGPVRLTFAFTCKEVKLRPDGRIRSYDENRRARFAAAADDEPDTPIVHDYRAELETAAPGPADLMLEIRD